MNTSKYYLLIPTLFTIVITCIAFFAKDTDLESVFYMLFWGWLFYTAPFGIWLVFIRWAKPSAFVQHSGYIACVLSLIVISSFWLLPPDPSGLPLQWSMYWPLSAILIAAFGVSVYIFERIRGT